MRRLLVREQPTLRLSFPFGRTFVLALLIFALMVGVLEAIFRLPGVTSHLPIPSTGGSRTDFDLKLRVLDAQQKQNGSVDCLFMGSSVILYGVKPKVFERAYQARTGQTIHCFNFALSALTPSDVPALAEFLIERYHPHLLVYGLSVREFSKVIEIRHKDDSIDSAWVEYRRGEFNVQGWLIDHFQAYRYYLAMDNWMTPSFYTQIEDRHQTELKMTVRGGYIPSSKVFVVPADLQILKAGQSIGREIGPEALTRFDQLVRLQPRFSDTELILVEVPVNPVLYTALFDEDTYHDLITRVETGAHSQDVFFLQDTDLPSLPPDAWHDEVHLNSTGAQIFSTWLGEQIGLAVNAGRLSPLTR